MISVDVTTWCSNDNKAAVSLKKILEEMEDEEKALVLLKYINRYLGSFNKSTKDLQSIKSQGTKEEAMKLFRIEIINRIKKNKLPDLIESHLLNIISTIFKQRVK